MAVCPRGKGGNSNRGGGLQTYNPVLEGDELLFLLLPALKVGFDEGLQFIQVLLHALAVDVLHQIEWICSHDLLGTVWRSNARGAPHGG